MWIKNIKDQTLVLLVSLTLGIVLVLSSLSAITAFVVEDSVISNFLDDQGRHLEKYYAQHGVFPPASFEFVSLYANVEAMPDWAQKAIDPQRIDGEIFTPDTSHYHYRKLALPKGANGYLLVEVSRLLVVTQQPRLWVVFLLVFFVAIAVAIFLAVAFSQKIVDPILALTYSIKSTESPKTAVQFPKLKYELGYLSDAMQISFDKLNRLLEQEKAFASNVSHELRTPLTVLKNSCLLISQRGFTPEDLVQIKNSGEQMEHIVDVLLALARTDVIELQPCNLRIELEEAILLCQSTRLEHFNINLDIPQGVTVAANSSLLRLFFINLLRNAVEHATEPHISITYTDGQLIFDNRAELIPGLDITRAGVKGDMSQGIGQGLYLVVRIAERFGWCVAFDTSQQRFRVLINFN